MQRKETNVKYGQYILSVIVAGMLGISVFAAPLDDTQKVQTGSKKTIEETKEAAKKLAEETKDVASELKEGAVEALQKAHEKVSQVVVAESTSPTGEELYSKCVACHGVDGTKHALGKSAVITGQSVDSLIKKLKAYKAGTRNVTGLGAFMHKVAAPLGESEILALAAYIDTFKQQKEKKND